MSIKLIKNKSGTLREVAKTYKILNLLTSDECSKLSIAIGNAVNHSETTVTQGVRVYYIMEGEMLINRSIKGKKGDVIHIPPKTKYGIEGTFNAMIINSPAFDKNADKTIVRSQ